MSSPNDLSGRVDELKALTKVRTATEFSQRAPGWLVEEAGSADDSATALAQRIDAISDPIFRAAATALFPLPYDTSPGSLSERRTYAARHFGVSASTFRTSTAARPSYEEQVLDAIVRASVAAPEEPGPSSARRPRSFVVPLLIAVAIVTVTVATIWTLTRRTPPATSPPSAAVRLPDATVPPAGPERQIDFVPSPSSFDAADADARVCPSRTLAATPARQARVEDHLRQLGRPTAVCQDIPAKQRWDMTVVKYLSADDATNWVDVEFGDGTYLIVPELAWSAYRSLRAFHGDADQPGPPVRWEIDASGRSQLWTESGEVVVAARPWLPHHFVTEPFVAAWTDQRDALGEPMANASIAELELERGHLRLPGGRVGASAIEPDEARGALPSDADLRNSVITQAAGQAWFIDAELRRWYIPDQATLKCLVRDRPPIEAVDGPSVALFDLAGIATCDFAELG